MNILITGGAGFIGSHMARFYAKNTENKVYIIDNLSRGQLLNKRDPHSLYNWKYLHKYNNIQFFLKDIRDTGFLKLFFNSYDIDIVIHCAAQTAVTTSMNNPREDFEVNTIGTFNLLEAIRKSHNHPVILYCSTNKVYGDNINALKTIEKELRYKFICEYGIGEKYPTNLCQHTPYGTSKLCADLYVQEYGQTYGLQTGVFRMSCIYGTRQFGVEDQGWVAHFIISALEDQIINIYGDGKQVRDVLYVSDLVNVFDKFINSPHGSDVFNVGGGLEHTVSLLELIMILEEILDKKVMFEFHPWRPSDQKVYISDISKAERILNWTPSIGIKEGVQKFIEWYKTRIDNKIKIKN